MSRQTLFNALPDRFTHSDACRKSAQMELDVSDSEVRSWIAVWRFKGLLGYKEHRYIKTPRETG
jgi:hypothetical protein